MLNFHAKQYVPKNDEENLRSLKEYQRAIALAIEN